jgi:hypothetical protein
MLALLVLVAPIPALDEFTDQLARLGAARAEVRAAAERWLSVNLTAERYSELAETALAADAEVRGRLERVLASDARHLALSLALATERNGGLSELGRAAVRAGVARSDARLAEPALRVGLSEFLRRTAERSPPRNLRLTPGLELEALLEQLELAGELPLGLTLDASAASRSFRRTAELPVEPWNRLVWRLREAGVELECHGVVPPREGAPTGGAFLRFATDLGPVRSGVDWVSEWLITLARKDGNEAERVRAARNLASSGFAPALEWMGELAERGADRAAREGLVRAAARGRVSSALTAPDVLGSLLLEAEQAGGHASARILVALTRLGCLDSHGAPLAGRFLAEFRAVSVRGRWTRLFLLERNRCASEAIFSEAQALLVDPATPAPLALQALHFCVARGEVLPGALRVAGLPAFFGLALDADESERLARALRLAGLKPPFRDPATVPADWQPPERARLLEAWLWSSDEEAAASHLAACLAGPTTEREARRGALVQSLERARARGEGARLERLLAKASTLQPPLEGELERMRLLLGLVPENEVSARVARTGLSLGGPEADHVLLGAMAGYPRPTALETQARDTLRALCAAAAAERSASAEILPLAAAVQRAIAGLFAARRDVEGFALARALMQALGRGDSPLALELERRGWLVPPGVEVRDLGHELAQHAIPTGL